MAVDVRRRGRPPMMAVGLVLIAAGLLGALAAVHVKGLRYFDRPAPARHPLFDRVLSVAAWVLVATGLIVVTRASRVAGVVVAGLLIAGWVWRRVVRSLAFQARLLRREYAAIARRHPGAAGEDLLRLLLARRHPEWGEELIDQMVRDYPTIRELSSMTARMERGFRGFRGGIRRAAGRSGPGSRS